TASSATRNLPNVCVNREPRATTVNAPPSSHLPAATSVSPCKESSQPATHFANSPAALAEKANCRYTKARYSTPPTIAPGGTTIANVLFSHCRPPPSHLPSRSDHTTASRRRPRESTF